MEKNAKAYALGDVVDAIFTGVSITRLHSDEVELNKARVINSRDLGESGVTAAKDLETVPLPAFSAIERFKVREGDVLISSRGVFKTARVGAGYEDCIAGPNLIVVRPGPRLESWLLFAFLSHPVIQTELQRRSVGTTVASISSSSLSKLRIHLPERDKQPALGRLVQLGQKQYVLGKKIAETRRDLALDLGAQELLP